MDEMVLQDRPGFFTKLTNLLTRPADVEEEDFEFEASNTKSIRASYEFSVTVRRQITSFDDAMAAANGLKRGELQILNLSGTDPAVRQKIVDFMCGVNYAQEGTWEEIGENVYIIVPTSGYVEVAPPSPRTTALKN